MGNQKLIFYQKVLKLIVGYDSEILDLNIIDDCFMFRIRIHNNSLGISNFQTIVVDLKENKFKIRMNASKNVQFLKMITEKKSRNIYRALNSNEYHLIKFYLQPGNGLLTGSSIIRLSQKINMSFIAKTLSTIQKQLD